MSNQLKQYNLLKRIAKERYDLRRMELDKKLEEFNQANSKKELLRREIDQGTEELNTRFSKISLHEFAILQLHRSHLRSLIVQDVKAGERLKSMYSEIESIETDCITLKIEVRKYGSLVDNLVASMASTAAKKDSIELDELWLASGVQNDRL